MKLRLPERRQPGPPAPSLTDTPLPSAPEPEPIGSLDPILETAVNSQPVIPEPPPQREAEPAPAPEQASPQQGVSVWTVAGLVGATIVAVLMLARRTPARVNNRYPSPQVVNHGRAPQPTRPVRRVIE
jgi:hypothetical protein